MTLIKLTDDMIVNAAAIETARRCGSYTEVLLRGEGEFGSRLHEIWDPEKRLWGDLLRACRPVLIPNPDSNAEKTGNAN